MTQSLDEQLIEKLAKQINDLQSQVDALSAAMPTYLRQRYVSDQRPASNQVPFFDPNRLRYVPTSVASVLASLLTTKGDLLTYSTLPLRLGVGADDTVLMARASETPGLIWIGRSTTTEIADVAATESAGTDDTVPRGDHAHAHQAAQHQSGGAMAIKLDDLASPDDNTDLNASASAHGLLPKLSNVVTEFLNGTGAFSAPGGGMKQALATYTLPLGPSAGVTVTKSATANTYGDAAALGTVSVESYVLGVLVEDFSAANNYAQISLDCGPRFISAGALTSTTSNSTNVAAPAGIEDNDILILAVIQRGNTNTLTVPNGFTKFVEQNVHAGAADRVTLAWKRAASEAGTYTVSFTGTGDLLAGEVTAWRGCITSASPISGTATVSDNASSDNVTYATYTPSRPGVKVVAVGFYANDLTTAGTPNATDPVLMNHFDAETASGTDASLFIYSGTSLQGAATGSFSHSTTSTADAANTGVVFGLLGTGGAVVCKMSATSLTAQGNYFIPIDPPAIVGAGVSLAAAWAGNNAAGDTCVISALLVASTALEDMA